MNNDTGHNRIVPSRSALASSVPCGLNATPDTPPLGPMSAGMGAPMGWPVLRWGRWPVRQRCACDGSTGQVGGGAAIVGSLLNWLFLPD